MGACVINLRMIGRTKEENLLVGNLQLKENMKKSITLRLSDEELMELEHILLDEDKEEALRFLKTHLEKQVKATISGESH